jgi:hypothetical protein
MSEAGYRTYVVEDSAHVWIISFPKQEYPFLHCLSALSRSTTAERTATKGGQRRGQLWTAL